MTTNIDLFNMTYSNILYCSNQSRESVQSRARYLRVQSRAKPYKVGQHTISKHGLLGQVNDKIRQINNNDYDVTITIYGNKREMTQLSIFT